MAATWGDPDVSWGSSAVLWDGRPAHYPRRGAWSFHNVTRDFAFWPTLDSILISEAQPLDLATFSCSVVDKERTIVFDNEDEVRVRFAGVKVFAGHIKMCEEDQVSEVGDRRYNLDAQDYTAKLDDSVIDHPAERASESLAARVAWILGFLNYPITATSLALPAETCEAADFDGQTVREALQSECDEHRLSMYVDFDKDLHLFRTEVVTAPFVLDDTAPDYASSFPYREYKRSRDSVELATAVYVQGEKDQTWVSDGPAIALYQRQERAVSESNLKTSTARTNAGLRALAEQATPVIDGHLVCYQPGLRGGMTAHIVNELWGIDNNFVLTGVDIAAVDPHDDDGTAYLRSEVSFSDRRKARGSHRDTTNKDSRKRPPSSTPRAAEMCDSSWTIVASADHIVRGGMGVPVAYGASGAPAIESALRRNIPWPSTDCGVSCGGWDGVVESEAWYTIAKDPLDADVIELVLGFAPASSYAGATAIVGVASSDPTDFGQWIGVGSFLLSAGGSVTVPRWALADLAHLVLAPGWHATEGFWCGVDLVSECSGPVVGGEGGSGIVGAPAVTCTPRRFCSGGSSGWVSGDGLIDGDNREFAPISWSGEGPVEVRVGAIILGAGDYTLDRSGRTVTLDHAPPAGSNVAFDYDVAL